MKTKLMLAAVLFAAGLKAQNSGQIAYSDAADYYLQEYQLAQTFQGKEMSKEAEEKILKSMSPEMRAKFEEIKKLDKNKYNQLLRTRFPFGVGNFGPDNQLVEVYGLSNAGEKEKQDKSLEIDVELLALKLKNSDGASQQQIKKDLTDKLADLFDAKENQKQKEVERLEKRLQELKESLKYRKQNKNEIVQRRIQELLGDSKYLRWE